MSIGCKRDAERALRGELQALDSGAYRRVYVDVKFRFVYKICWDGTYESWDANREEHDNAQRLFDEGIPGVPRTTLYVFEGRTVLAMRYFPLASWEHPTRKASMKDMPPIWESKIADLHAWNWRRTPNGSPRLTDLQY